MSATTAQKAVARGQDFTWTFTLEGSGSIAGATLTGVVRRRGTRQPLLSGLSLTISDAANRVCVLALTAAHTLKLIGDESDSSKRIDHTLTVTMTLAGVVTKFGPLVFPVWHPD